MKISKKPSHKGGARGPPLAHGLLIISSGERGPEQMFLTVLIIRCGMRYSFHLYHFRILPVFKQNNAEFPLMLPVLPKAMYYCVTGVMVL